MSGYELLHSRIYLTVQLSELILVTEFTFIRSNNLRILKKFIRLIDCEKKNPEQRVLHWTRHNIQRGINAQG